MLVLILFFILLLTLFFRIFSVRAVAFSTVLTGALYEYSRLGAIAYAS